MNELIKILKKDDEYLATHQGRILATVTRVDGSSYRRAGARMLIGDRGETSGCVSGGCLERDLVRQAQRVSRTGQAIKLVYDTREDLEEESFTASAGLGCEGEIEIWLEPIAAGIRHVALEYLKKQAETHSTGLLMLFTKSDWLQGVSAGDYYMLGELPELDGKFNHEISKVKSTGKILGLDGLLIEPVLPLPELIILGAGYDASCMCELAATAGFRVSVLDCRSSVPLPASAFAQAYRYLKGDAAEVLSKVRTHERTALILMTHHADHDLTLFREALARPFAYLGILGPRKRGLLFLEEMRKQGIQLIDEKLAKIFFPVGLDLGGDSPAEVALSAISQITSVLNKRSAKSLRDFGGPIHEREIQW